MEVTVLTPTYNRAYTIEHLYKSLCNQTCKNFKWLVVDDGSIDNTKDVINKYINENKINIEYIYQKNGGKHRALNNGIKRINSELTIFVDSDDWLTDDAIENVIFYGEKYKDNEKIACISFHRSFSNGEIIGKHYREKEFINNYISYRINENVFGDAAEVCYTEKLKEFPFAEIKGENFLSEGFLWISMALRYDTVYVDKSIYFTEYLEDGLTKNVKKINLKNPIGCIEVFKLYLNAKGIRLTKKFKVSCKYIAYGSLINYNFIRLSKEIGYKFWFIILYPLLYSMSIWYKNVKM